MKKSILNLGKALNRAEQREVSGELRHYLGNECNTNADCPPGDHEIIKCCSGNCIYLNQNAVGIC